MENNGNGLLSQHSLQQYGILLVMLWLTAISCSTVHSSIYTEEEEIRVYSSDKSWAKKNKFEYTSIRNWLLIFYVCVSYSDLGGIIESVDPVHEILLVIGLQEELPHPSIDD